MSSPISTNVAPTCLPNGDVPELDWLLEMAALAAHPKGPPQVNDPLQRLARVMTASLEHFDSLLGALLIPSRNVRLVSRADGTQSHIAEEALVLLEERILSHTRRHQRPMLLDNAVPGSTTPAAWRLLSVPVAAGNTAADGALIFMRAAAAPPFSAVHPSIARHLGRHVSSILEAELDPITGLYTRAGMQRYVRSLGDRRENPPRTHAVICIDIDRLHLVNKVSGFESGDALITRLVGLLREPPIPEGAAAARISGNEFAIVLPDASDESAQRTAAEFQRRVSGLMGEGPFAYQPLSLSCGVASFSHPEDFQRGLVLAELACRTAKERGRNRVEIYQDNDISMVRRDAELVALRQFHETLRGNRLTLFAQKIISLDHQDHLAGYELLLRSLDQPRENHAPAELLATALRSELAPDLDLWVIERAISEALPYRSDLESASVCLSINIAGPSLTDDRLLQRALRLIRLSGLPPALIMFEITETVAVLNLAKAVRFMQEFRGIGCRFALDDFGTGTNSLKNLINLPVDRIKIDGSFVSNILTNRQSAAMVRGIASLGRDLGITTVAEYAENEQIIERLREFGVGYAQGYGIDKPRPVSEAFRELQAQQTMWDSGLSRKISAAL